MPSVGLHGDENIHPRSALSAFPSRKGTRCSHMAGDILSAKKIATFSLEMGPLVQKGNQTARRSEQSLVV